MDYELIKPDAQDAYDPAPFLNYARARRTDKEERDASVADVVHFWHGAYCLAAIVLADPTFGGPTLRVLVPAPGADRESEHVDHDEAKLREGTWHWPCGES